MSKKRIQKETYDATVSTNKYKPYGSQGNGIDVICDHCGNKFNVLPHVLDVVHSYDHIIAEGFTCKECGKKYITMISNNKLRYELSITRTMRAEMTKRQRDIKTEADMAKEIHGIVPILLHKRLTAESEKILKEYKDKVESNKAMHKEVKERYYQIRGINIKE